MDTDTIPAVATRTAGTTSERPRPAADTPWHGAHPKRNHDSRGGRAQQRRVFRQHDQPPPELPSDPALRQLLVEWPHLNHSPASEDSLSSWSRPHPVLGSHRRLGDLVDAIDASAPETADQMLGALRLLAQGGDQLAMRVLLQAMLPGLWFMHARYSAPDAPGPSDAEEFSDILGTFYEVALRDGAAPHRQAASLRLDTLHRITYRNRRGVDLWYRHLRANTEIDSDTHLPTPSIGDTYPTLIASAGPEECADLAELLTWAQRTNAISTADIEVLGLLYLTSTRPDWDAVATRLGCTRKTLNRRHERAKDRLAAAVLANLRGRRLHQAA
jgi:hypothetical protein